MTNSRSQFVSSVLAAYRKTPGASGLVRAADRKLAGQLFDDNVPLKIVTAALALAATRRFSRPDDADPLETIRSLHYFKPVIAELQREKLPPSILDYFEIRLQRFTRSP